MERSSRVLQHGNPKCEFHKTEVEKDRKIRPGNGTLQGYMKG